VYLVLLRFANYDSGSSFPTVKTIRRLSGVNKNRIAEATGGLEQKGLIEKVRAGKNFAFRCCYRVIRHPKIVLTTIPKKGDKCRHSLRGKDGRFKPLPKNRDSGIPKNADNLVPTNSESDTFPKNRDKKKNLEILNRDKNIDKTDSASACSKKQASPVSNSKKSLKTINKETIDGFIKDKGLKWVKEYLRKNGYDKNEIDNLCEVEGSDGERVSTARKR